jgi:hypothetical protein
LPRNPLRLFSEAIRTGAVASIGVCAALFCVEGWSSYAEAYDLAVVADKAELSPCGKGESQFLASEKGEGGTTPATG